MELINKDMLVRYEEVCVEKMSANNLEELKLKLEVAKLDLEVAKLRGLK